METLNKELNRSEDRARKVRDRIDSVRSVSDNEWDKELRQYSDRSMRAENERELKQTRQRAVTLIRSMEKPQRRIEPVLTGRDQILIATLLPRPAERDPVGPAKYRSAHPARVR